MALDLEPVALELEPVGDATSKLDLQPVVEPSRTVAIPAPGEMAPTARGSVLAGPTQAFPANEQRAEGAIAAATPELSLEEAEQLLTAPQVSLPRIGAPGTVTRGLSELGGGLIEQAALTPAAPLINLATAIPSVRVAAGALLSAAAAKGAAQKLGEASVTGNAQTITEGVGQAVLAGLGVAGTGVEALRVAGGEGAIATEAAKPPLLPATPATSDALAGATRTLEEAGTVRTIVPSESKGAVSDVVTPETVAERLVPWGETAVLDADAALAQGSKAYHEQGQVFTALSNAFGIRPAMKMARGEIPYPSKAEFLELNDAYLTREAYKMVDTMDSQAARLGKKLQRPSRDDYQSGRAFYDAVVNASADVSKSGAALEASLVERDRPSVTPTTDRTIATLPSASRPLGIVSSVTPAIGNVHAFLTGATDEARLFLRGAAGESLPRMVEANPAAGEAGISHAAARQWAPREASLFVDKAIEGTGVDPTALGAAIVEDNLRDIRAKRIAAGEDPATVQVNTIVGKRGSPFADEASYQDFLVDEPTQQALAQYKQLWQEVKEPLYKLASSIDPETPLPTRGLQTGARVNLYSLPADTPVPEGVRVMGGGGGGNLLATLRRKSPFARKATGEGARYVINLHDLMAHSFEGDLAIAMKNKMDNALVESGDAAVVRGSPKEAPTLKGEKTVAFPYRNLTLALEGEPPLPLSQKLYVRESLAGEYRRLAGVDAPIKLPIITAVGERLTRAALQGFSEGTIHVSNLLTGLFTRPGPTSNLLVNSLLKATGRADLPVTLTRTLIKAFSNNKAQLASLAEIGALKESYRGSMLGPFLNRVVEAVRLTLDDTYKGLADAGVVENTPAARREFINQVGQYNKRLQGPLIKMLRETQLGPFATASRAFGVLGLRTATLSPGVRATSATHAALLRADALAGWVGFAALTATWNYLHSGNAGGTPGTRLGDLDLGTDAAGKHHIFPLADLLGYGRALRVTGARGAIESKRIGLSNANAMDRAAKDIVDASIGPALGPVVRAGYTAVTGLRPSATQVQETPLNEAQSTLPQIASNIEHVLLEANPVVASIYEAYQGRPAMDIVQRQLTRFAPRSAPSSDLVEALPRIVDKRQMEDYIDNIGSRARKLTPVASAKLFDQAREALDKLEDPKLRREGRAKLRSKEKYVQ